MGFDIIISLLRDSVMVFFIVLPTSFYWDRLGRLQRKKSYSPDVCLSLLVRSLGWGISICISEFPSTENRPLSPRVNIFPTVNRSQIFYPY